MLGGGAFLFFKGQSSAWGYRHVIWGRGSPPTFSLPQRKLRLNPSLWADRRTAGRSPGKDCLSCWGTRTPGQGDSQVPPCLSLQPLRPHPTHVAVPA